MKPIQKILSGIEYKVEGTLPEQVSSISNNSKNISQGDIFFAIRGTETDGHKYIKSAIDNGAVAVVVEEKQTRLNIPQIIVNNSRQALSIAAKNYYGDPSRDLKVIGITGTNGKTSTVNIFNQIISSTGILTGTIGTLGYTIGDDQYDCSLTTPSIIDLQKIFKKMLDKNVEIAAMEVSSHAIALGRVHDIHFHGGCFTNLSQDHLDFHKTMEEYAETKAKLFSMIDRKGFALYNKDSSYAGKFITRSSAELFSFSINDKKANYYWSDNTSFHSSISGKIHTPNKEIKINCPLSGKFNLQNILAATAIADQLKINASDISKALAKLKPIPGRLQEIKAGKGPRVFIDYAHTPDAISSILVELRALLPDGGRLIALFGCGGNRDRKKRPLMSKAVEQYADLPVLTTDNPRYEDPEKIIMDAEKGFSGEKNYKKIVDRKEAIKWSINKSNEKDIIAILGKGHETYQDIKGKKYPFSDHKIVQENLS